MAARARIAEMNNRASALFLEGDMAMAEALFGGAIAQMSPGEDDLAGMVYENLGMARFNPKKYRPAVRAFMRALRESVAMRPQSAAFIVRALTEIGAWDDARMWLERHEEVLGPHPGGLTARDIDARQREAARQANEARGGPERG